MKFNAYLLARAWSSVALAAGADDHQPKLYRTTLIEVYDEGWRLVATDGFILLKAWVPYWDEYDDEPEPPPERDPLETAVCRDSDLRVLNLMKFASKLATKDGPETDLRIEAGFGVLDGQGQLAGLADESVWFRLDSDVTDERIEAPQYDGEFPTWRELWANHRWEQTGIVSFGADGILRLGKLSRLWGRAAVTFQLGGQVGVAKIIVHAPDATVSGLAMPVRSHDDSVADEAEPPAEKVPPSPEAVTDEFRRGLDQFLADVLDGRVEPDADADAVADDDGPGDPDATAADGADDAAADDEVDDGEDGGEPAGED